MPRAYNALPPVTELWKRFEYQPLTGELVWRVNRQKALVGSEAGGFDAKGYKRVRVGTVFHKTHRVIWAWVTGEDPGAINIDHKDGNPANNRWTNLRLATDLQNSQNRRGKGYRYLYREGRTKNWYVVFQHNKKIITGGYYATEPEAAAAAKKLKAQHLGAWNREHHT